MKTKTKERPIIFSGPMVRAILDDRKTQTRRIVKNVPEGLRPGRCHYVNSTWAWCEDDGSPQGGGCRCSAGEIKCPYGQPGDRLWVREIFNIESFGAGVAQIRYAADNQRGKACGVSDRKLPDRVGTVAASRMPRHCCRLVLEVISVRVERLQDISETDALAEGTIDAESVDEGYSPIGFFASLWEWMDGPGSWGANPWVWVIEFQRVEP